jgi:hypothetical protein
LFLTALFPFLAPIHGETFPLAKLSLPFFWSARVSFVGSSPPLPVVLSGVEVGQWKVRASYGSTEILDSLLRAVSFAAVPLIATLAACSERRRSGWNAWGILSSVDRRPGSVFGTP